MQKLDVYLKQPEAKSIRACC